MRPRAVAATGLVVAAIVAFVALGIWQLERRTWKLDLIARVDARLAVAPVEAPGPDRWPALTPGDDAYTRVRATGRFLGDREVAVLAVTDLGSGYWILTPLETGDFTVLVNRGFVPQDRRDPATRPESGVDGTGPVTVTGLLRMTEPGGGFLRRNDPAAGRWYSRDVAAIAASEALAAPVAPYFIDADADADANAGATPGELPVGGLTVVRFRNAHLSYALTWFGLAILVAVLAIRAARYRQR